MKKKELLLLLEKYKDNDKVDFTTIGDNASVTQLVNMGYINKTKHPDLPIYIYNYTDKCQYEQKWNEHTTTHRGLIKDESGNVIARSFDKIFNLSELSGRKKRELLDGNELIVQEKLDGSMLIAFYYEGERRTATRGSFTSEQAIEGLKILQENNYFDHMNIANTYIFEVIYPENRVVVDYQGKRRYVLLAVFNKDQQFIGIPEHCRKVFDLVKNYGVKDIGEIERMRDDGIHGEEGFICGSGTRLFKVKFDEYMDLHRTIFNYNPEKVFDLIKNGQRDFSYLPDEYHAQIKRMIEYYEIEYQFIKNACHNEYQILGSEKRNYLDFQYANVIFAYIDFKDVSKYINNFIKLPTTLGTHKE